MELALTLAKETVGQTSPNPVVGAVLVKNNQVIGLGAHLKAGEPHAEVHAIRMAGEKAKGATLYVTLEPCHHFGRTPPCCDLIIQSGIQKVYVATQDPNALVSGKGIEKMKQAGIDVEVGLLEEEARKLNQVFFHFIQTGLPYVTLKAAVSLDGKTATYTGESQWITSRASRQDVHHFRHTHDAILVGVNTVIKDDPRLTVRVSDEVKPAVRVILDTSLRTPLGAKIIQDHEAPTWIVVGSEVTSEWIRHFTDLGIKIIQMNSKHIPIQDMLSHLGELGITSLFVEGGAEVLGSFLKERHFQRVITYIAPKLIGGSGAPTSFAGDGIANIDEALSLEIEEVCQIGPDIRIVSIPKWGGEI
ncbi:bifunctional diaminohydroxyphosphoribosylaminopyrimidine deaminase/5-amino-6-(5-phosphoribosylamino)uracil reductase RibD [Pullulanibacillus pueri]|nr:bifunctional diaminohydroxyphosphoribosylaminopyrimidine deaminase/5-amino-6-(5-phosphoribosylamino)uracil reductase RibD [Pullulanibacillus pueri]